MPMISSVFEPWYHIPTTSIGMWTRYNLCTSYHRGRASTRIFLSTALTSSSPSNSSTQTAAPVECAARASRGRRAYNNGQPRVWDRRRPSAAAPTTSHLNTHVDVFLPVDPAALSLGSVVPQSVDIRAPCTKAWARTAGVQALSAATAAGITSFRGRCSAFEPSWSDLSRTCASQRSASNPFVAEVFPRAFASASPDTLVIYSRADAAAERA